MPQITIKNQARISGAIKKALQTKMKKIFSKGSFLLDAQAQFLQTQFANSEEFRALKGKLQGEFGFTNEEVKNLDRILDLMVPGKSEITISKIRTGPNQFLMSLEWVDFKKLKAHEFAQHELTRLDAAGRVVDITDIISWVEWLEEGATIKGYEFFRPSRARSGTIDSKAFSRSGQGLMKRTDSNFWTFNPTRVFESIAKAENGKFIKKGFGLLVKRFGK